MRSGYRSFLIPITIFAAIIISTSSVEAGEIEDLQSKFATMQKELDSQESQINTMNKEIAGLKTGLATSQTQVSAANTQITNLRSDLTAAQAQISNANSQITAIQSQAALVRTDVNQLKANDATLVAKLTQWFRALEEFKGSHFLLPIHISGGAIGP